MDTSRATPVQEALLAERYGRRPGRGRAGLLVAATALGLLFLGFALWYVRGVAAEPLHWTDIGFDVTGPERVDVTFRLEFADDVPAGAAAVCTLRALNATSAEIGRADVTVTRGEGRAVITTAGVPTGETAATGLVQACVLR